jgi:cobalt-zinc-cadmium efflux system membrane fusion protein
MPIHSTHLLYPKRLLLIIGFLAVLLTIILQVISDHHIAPPAPDTSPVVSLSKPRIIAVKSGSLLEKKLTISTVQKQQIITPLLVVTGAVVARLPKGSGPTEDRWQFNSLDLSAVYADWLRAATEKDFNTKRLVKIRELTAARYNSQKIAVDRLRKLVATGTEAIRDLTSAEASLLEIQLEGQKDVYEAETALTVATRTRAALERKLFQEGIQIMYWSIGALAYGASLKFRWEKALMITLKYLKG